MSSPAHCPPSLVPVAMPAEFSLLCRSLLVRDPVYGRLMTEEAPPSYDGLSGLRFTNEQENSHFLLGPRSDFGKSTLNS